MRAAVWAVPLLLLLLPASGPLATAHHSPGAPWDVQVTDDLLPAETGWFLVPITTDRDTTVTYEQTTIHQYNGNGGTGHVELFWLPGSSTMSLGGFAAGGEFRGVELNLDGERVDCCEGGRAGKTGAARGTTWGHMPLKADETIWVGLAAYRWSPYNDYFSNFSSEDATLTVGTPVTGLEVGYVDLVREAAREGDNLRVRNEQVAGELGRATFEWTPGSKGVLAVEAYVRGSHAAATVDVRVDGAPLLDNVRVDDSTWARAAWQGEGTARVEVGDVVDGDGNPLLGVQQLEIVALYAEIPAPGAGSWASVW